MVGFIWLEKGRGHGAYPKGGSYSDAAGRGVRVMDTESGLGAHCWLWPWLPGRGAGSERGRK